MADIPENFPIKKTPQTSALFDSILCCQSEGKRHFRYTGPDKDVFSWHRSSEERTGFLLQFSTNFFVAVCPNGKMDWEVVPTWHNWNLDIYEPIACLPAPDKSKNRKRVHSRIVSSENLGEVLSLCVALNDKNEPYEIYMRKVHRLALNAERKRQQEMAARQARLDQELPL